MARSIYKHHQSAPTRPLEEFTRTSSHLSLKPTSRRMTFRLPFLPPKPTQASPPIPAADGQARSAHIRRALAALSAALAPLLAHEAAAQRRQAFFFFGSFVSPSYSRSHFLGIGGVGRWKHEGRGEGKGKGKGKGEERQGGLTTPRDTHGCCPAAAAACGAPAAPWRAAGRRTGTASAENRPGGGAFVSTQSRPRPRPSLSHTLCSR